MTTTPTKKVLTTLLYPQDIENLAYIQKNTSHRRDAACIRFALQEMADRMKAAK